MCTQAYDTEGGMQHLTAAEKTHILISLVDDLHICADIMQFRENTNWKKGSSPQLRKKLKCEK